MEQHVFSKSNKYFASISENGVLKVWDAETQTLKCDYIPNLQTSAPCTSLIWVTLAQSKRGSAGQDCLVLGTQKGGVAIFSLSTGKLEATLKGTGHAGAVTGMCYDDEQTVYTAGEDSKVIVWSLTTGAQTRSWDLGNERPTALALSLDKKKLITASRQIKLWTIKTNECKQTYTGHASAVQFLKVVQFEDAEYLLSGSKQNRNLSLWNLRATSKKRDSLATFSLEDVPHFVDAVCQNGTLSVVAVCRNNIVYHFVEAMAGVIASVKPIKFSASVNVVAEKKGTAVQQVATIPTVAASVDDLSNLFIAYGNALSLKFERVRLQKGKRSEVLIRKDPRKIHAKAKLAAEHRGTVDPIVDASQVEYSMIQSARKSLKPNDIQIGKRLENLSLAKGDSGDHSSPASNKTQLLIQGLHSNDKTILAEIFSTNDHHSVRSTLQKLPPQYIGSLINELTALMQQKIDKIEMGVSWMKVLLQTHTSQLMALGADELMNRFGPCMGIIEHRIHNLKNLNRIKGRLDLLLNQMEDQPKMDIIETASEQMLVYQDESDEDGIEEDDDDDDSSNDGDSDVPEKMNGVGGAQSESEDENMVTDDDSRPTDEDDDEDEDLESD